MRTKLKIVCTLMFLSMVGNVMAQSAPPAVTGIAAVAQGNTVAVTWDAVTSDPIAYYRVYYSAKSILDNDGLFDDFETTQADETSLSLSTPPNTSDMYVSVIGVSESGLESEYFMEEAHATLDSTSTPEVAAPTTTTQPTANASDLRLLKAEVTSPTTIVATFSTAVTVDPTKAPEGLSITTADGVALPIAKINIKEETITITTQSQTKGTVYSVAFSEPFIGTLGQPLDTTDRQVFVTGHSDGTAPTQTPTQNTQSLSDMQEVSITSQMQPDGNFTVIAQWTPNTNPDLYGIVVYQTRDGQTFGPPSLLPTEIRGVQLQNVTPGFFGLYIQAANAQGHVSPGVFTYVNLLPGATNNAFQGSVTATQPISITAAPAADIATIETITEDTPTQKIEGVDHPAAAQTGGINMEHVAILAVGTTMILILAISAFILIKRRRSTEV